MYKNNIVRVWIGDPHKDGKFNGTAFLVNGHTLITAKHVVTNKQGKIYEDINLTATPNGGVVPIDEVLLCERDIAILTIKKYFPITSILRTNDLRIGSSVEIHGFHDSKGDRGCKKHLVSGYLNNTHTFELQNHLSGGFSGSPVFLDNKLCGITQAIHSKKNITYIIPISECCDKSIFEQEESIDVYNSKELKAVKEFLKDMPMELLKAKVYKYLPISYFATLPNSVSEIIDELLKISVIKESCVPILSILEENTNRDVIDFVQYLKDVKFKNIEKSKCTENKEVSELSFLINFSKQDGKTQLKVETWRYANGETHQILKDFSEIDLEVKKDLNEFLDAIYVYANEAVLLYDSKISIEIILPNEKLFEGIKKWENSTGHSLIRKYKYIYRMQSRFKNPDNSWKSKWAELDIDKSRVKLNDKFKSRYIEQTMYNGELVSENYSVILQEKINNPNFLFEDIKEFGIPIVISSLSKECNIKEIKDFELKECQEEICNYIMYNHDNYKSDIFLMIDNPDKIPEEFKKPEQNLYGW